MYRQGWLFIPTWVGPQAPCTNFRNRFSYNVNEAYQQGVDNANQAVAKLKELYLTNSDGTGSIVYYDLEYFPYSSQCSAAARSFVNGWTARLQQLGTRSGALRDFQQPNAKYFLEYRKSSSCGLDRRMVQNARLSPE